MTRPAVRSGYTLIEVLLVMAILVSFAAIAMPSISAMYGDIRVKAAADQVRGSWTECRAYSIDEGRPYRFAVQPNTGKFRIAPDSPESWGGSSGDSSASVSEDTALPSHTSEGELPKSIVFTVPDGLGETSADGWTTVVTFLPDGSCASDREITLSADDDTSPIVIRVRAMTGAVSVRNAPKTGGK
ncbi:pilus assembly FimT family protein [Zavarzinella formosa]|uniref:pilus assembly FimT family protein n=1 Tax=Zavarzinella formosa TaxID=360055 RepID=UPI0003039444|nr:prepilin-type N-terminal cleavage/methylation domain-containing protein [Zavarzinella formosa]